jgi:four helix bundle protein
MFDPMGQSYRELIAWQKATDFVMDVYRTTKAFPRDETYALASQLRRAAVAVPTNIAEGQARFSPNEFHFFWDVPADRWWKSKPS